MIFKKLYKDSKEPVRSTMHSAGLDVFAQHESVIKAGKVNVISTGLSMDTKDGEDNSEWYVAIHIRSSLSVKGLMLANGVAVIDKDYKDEIKVIIHNSTDEDMTINKGDKIAQMLIMAHYSYVAKGVTFKYDKRTGGLGHTGDK